MPSESVPGLIWFSPEARHAHGPNRTTRPTAASCCILAWKPKSRRHKSTKVWTQPSAKESSIHDLQHTSYRGLKWEGVQPSYYCLNLGKPGLGVEVLGGLASSTNSVNPMNSVNSVTSLYQQLGCVMVLATSASTCTSVAVAFGSVRGLCYAYEACTFNCWPHRVFWEVLAFWGAGAHPDQCGHLRLRRRKPDMHRCFCTTSKLLAAFQQATMAFLFVSFLLHVFWGEGGSQKSTTISLHRGGGGVEDWDKIGGWWPVTITS